MFGQYEKPYGAIGLKVLARGSNDIRRRDITIGIGTVQPILEFFGIGLQHGQWPHPKQIFLLRRVRTFDERGTGPLDLILRYAIPKRCDRLGDDIEYVPGLRSRCVDRYRKVSKTLQPMR